MTRCSRMLVALLAAASLGLPAAASASPTQESQLQDDPKFVYGSDRQVEALMQVLNRIGVDRLRVSVLWRMVAPNPESRTRPSFDALDPSAYDPEAWNRYDRIVNAAARWGVGIHFTITGPSPLWAARGDTGVWAPDPQEYWAFAIAVMRRYSGSWRDERPKQPPNPGGLPPLLPFPPFQRPAPPPPPVLPRVGFWSGWNEPNQPGWLKPQYRGGVPASPRIYRGLQDVLYSALGLTGHGGDTYLLGELAPRGTDNTRFNSTFRSVRFTRELYCLDRRMRPYRGSAAARRGCPRNAGERRRFVAQHPGLFRATGWAHHPYAFDAPPTARDPNPDNATLANLSRLTRTLDRALRRWGVRRRFPIWFTEYGYQTDPPDPFFGVSWRRQSAYLNEAEALAYRNPRVRSVSQFLLYDDGPNTSYSHNDRRFWGSTFQTGLITHWGRQKDSWTAWQRGLEVRPHSARPGSPLWALGQLRPAAAGSALSARLQFRAKGSRRWRTVRRGTTRNPRNYLSLRLRARRSGFYRLAWRTGGGTLYSRTASVRVSR